MDINGNYIQSQFCSYEIALKLKELGFDEDCTAYYKSECTGENTLLSEFTLDHSKTVFYTQTNNNREISAPLWQQVIDWLDTNCNLLVVTTRDKIFGYNWKIAGKKNKSIYDCAVTYQRLYDAREQAILKAIELILNKTHNE